MWNILANVLLLLETFNNVRNYLIVLLFSLESLENTNSPERSIPFKISSIEGFLF
jgi:hypothetical protein